VENSEECGFELLILIHLETLKKEGITFDFPGRTVLYALREKKLSRFSPKILYRPQIGTLVHSLEAFSGQID
jgi:hypothetical protein